MTADRLRQAAQKIRDTADAATPGRWGVIAPPDLRAQFIYDTGGNTHIATMSLDGSKGADAALIALMASPPVALAVADWIDTAGADLWAHGPLHCAEGCMECDDDLWAPHVRAALALADLILGSDPA